MPYFGGEKRWRHLALEDRKLRLHPAEDGTMHLAREPVFRVTGSASGEGFVTEYRIKWPGRIRVVADPPPQGSVETGWFETADGFGYVTGRVNWTKTITVDGLDTDRSVVDDMGHEHPYDESALERLGFAYYNRTITVTYDDPRYAPSTAHDVVAVAVRRTVDRADGEPKWSEGGGLRFRYEGGTMSPEPQVETVMVPVDPQDTPVVELLDDADDFPRSDYYPRVDTAGE